MLRKMYQELWNSCNTLQHGKILLYPTDTVWGIGCDATNLKFVQKIYSIKNRQPNKAMILLVRCVKILKRIVEVPQPACHLIRRTWHPLTLIYKHSIGAVFSHLSAHDGSLAVRITKDPFCQAMIHRFGKPLISTSANFSGCPTPLFYNQIKTNILEAADYIVDLQKKNQDTYHSTSILVQYNEYEGWQIVRK